MLDGVFAMGYNAPSRIQGLAIPAILKNPYGLPWLHRLLTCLSRPQNFIGQAQSGTGKTAAFSLSVITRVDESVQSTQGLVIAPTRYAALVPVRK